MGVPNNGWFLRENPKKEMDENWGYPPFQETSININNGGLIPVTKKKEVIQPYSTSSNLMENWHDLTLFFEKKKWDSHLEVSINWGTQKWLVYFMENPTIKWMMTGGTPMAMETPIFFWQFSEPFVGGTWGDGFKMIWRSQ